MWLRLVLAGIFCLGIVVCFSNDSFAQKLDYPVSISNQDVLDTIASFKTDNPTKTVALFQSKLPPVTDAKTRRFVLDNAPKKLLELQIKDTDLETKIRFLIKPLLMLYGRENAYQIVVFKHQVPFIAVDTGTVLYISSGFLLETTSDDELLGAMAHEIGHEYFLDDSIITKHLLNLIKTRTAPNAALEKKFGDVLALIELECDAFAAITLAHLGFDPTAFIDGLERMTKKYKAEPNGLHPADALRRQVIEAVIPSSYIKKDKRKVSITLAEIKELVRPQRIQLEPLPNEPVD